MSGLGLLDPADLLSRIADRVPTDLRGNIVVIGSIAAAWAFRDISGTGSVATKDIDLLLRPAVDAINTAETLGQQLLERGWQPHYPNGIQPGSALTPNDQLPALRLSPPDDEDHWFVELLGEPQAGQIIRKVWRRFETEIGHFALPCYRYMPVAVHAAAESDYGLRIAKPSCMALAHLLEHSDPDTTPIANLPGNPPRFVKDVGRAISLWWLAMQQTPFADEYWQLEWRETLDALYPNSQKQQIEAAKAGLSSIHNLLLESHAIALNGVLAPHGTTLQAWRRAYASLLDLIEIV